MDIILLILLVIAVLYTLSVAGFIILENRSPQSTFAWLFLFVILPVGGLFIYLFFGRSWRAFSYESKLAQQELGGDLTRLLSPRLWEQEKIVKEFAKNAKGYKKKLPELVLRNSNSALSTFNRLEILQNATAKYPRLLADLRQARHSIHLQYYIWTEDEFTQQVKEVLIERAQAGVEVRCLYDATGGGMSYAYLAELRQAGVAIHPYLPYQSLFKLHTINYRSHRKMAIIDGKIGYVGGLNLDKDQIDGGLYFEAWRDTHVRIIGEAANILQAVFMVSWYNTTKEILSEPAYFPRLDREINNWLPIQVTTSGPDSQWAGIRQLYFFMILAAEEKVYIQSPFIIPDESITEALKAAALSGVDVRIMCAPRGTTYAIPYWAANTYFEELAEAGVKIYLYQKGYFHPKTVNIDSAICSIGTANLDIRSFAINYEINAVIYDARTAQALEQDFLKDLQDCIEFDLKAYKERHVLLRLRDSLCRLASPLL